MNLIDVIEMLCDWKAATMRHADGDIKKSIEINQKRFGYSDELKAILLNTIEFMHWQPLPALPEEGWKTKKRLTSWKELKGGASVLIVSGTMIREDVMSKEILNYAH